MKILLLSFAVGREERKKRLVCVFRISVLSSCTCFLYHYYTPARVRSTSFFPIQNCHLATTPSGCLVFFCSAFSNCQKIPTENKGKEEGEKKTLSRFLRPFFLPSLFSILLPNTHGGIIQNQAPYFKKLCLPSWQKKELPSHLSFFCFRTLSHRSRNVSEKILLHLWEQ